MTPFLKMTCLILAMPIALSIGCTATKHNARTASRPAAHVDEGPPLPLAVASHAGGLIDGVPVVAGGTNWSADRTTKTWRSETYFLHNGKWVTGPALPQPNSDAAYASDGNALYIAGGSDGQNPTTRVLRLSGTSPQAQWEDLPALPAPVEGANGAIVNDTLYVIGGFSDSQASNQMWSLNLSLHNATWQPEPDLPASGRGYSAFVAVGSRLYHFGGFTLPPYHEALHIYDDAHIYDPSSRQWQRIDLSLPGYGWTATAIDEHSIMFTGRVAAADGLSDEIWMLDLATHNCQMIGHLVIQSCCMPSIRTGRNRWLIPGGEPDANRSRTERSSIISLDVQ